MYYKVYNVFILLYSYINSVYYLKREPGGSYVKQCNAATINVFFFYCAYSSRKAMAFVLQ